MGNQLAPATKQGASLETQGELLNVVVKETLGVNLPQTLVITAIRR
jgi:hypothetical protein